jgi:hypothetical protein
MTAADVILEAIRRDPSLTVDDLCQLARVKRQWVSMVLRKHGIKAAPARKGDKEAQLVVRVTNTEKIRFRHASRVAGLDVSEWVRTRLSKAAETETGRPAATT